MAGLAVAEAPTRGGWRLVRGGAVAAVALLLTVAGHAAAGGAVPDAGLLVVLGLLLAGVLVALADRQPSLGALVLTLGGTQLALHVLLDALAGHAHGAAVTMTATSPVPMITAHVVLTLLTGCLLRGADRALFAIAAGLARAMPRLLPAPPPARAACRPTANAAAVAAGRALPPGPVPAWPACSVLIAVHPHPPTLRTGPCLHIERWRAH